MSGFGGKSLPKLFLIPYFSPQITAHTRGEAAANLHGSDIAIWNLLIASKIQLCMKWTILNPLSYNNNRVFVSLLYFFLFVTLIFVMKYNWQVILVIRVTLWNIARNVKLPKWKSAFIVSQSVWIVVCCLYLWILVGIEKLSLLSALSIVWLENDMWRC